MVQYQKKKNKFYTIAHNAKDKFFKFFSVIGFCFCFLCNSKYDDDDENYRENELREPMAKIRLGFKGKDTWINSEGINIHQMFGKYSVLLDSDDQIVPLTKNGELIEPLDCRKNYKVVANHYGTTAEPQKWKELKKKEINDRKQFNLFKKQFRTTQQIKQQEQLNQYNSIPNNNSNNNNQQKQQPLEYSNDQNIFNNSNNSILDTSFDDNQIDIFINDNNNNNNSINTEYSNILNNDNNSYSFVEFVNNNNNNNNNNNSFVNNIKKDFNIDNKFYT